MKSSTKEKMTIVKEILLTTLDTAQGLCDIINHPAKYAYNYPQLPSWSRKTIYDTVSRLENEGYLKEVEIRGEKKYLATLKGKAKVLRFLKINKNWDKKWRIVVFDVPEKMKRKRDDFRRRLENLGFRQLQKSVWICPYNTADLVEELIKLYDLEDYVHYLLVEEIDNREVLTKLFNLKNKL